MGKAYVILTLRIMPASPDVDLGKLQINVDSAIKAFGGAGSTFETKPFAFGLKATEATFQIEESKGSAEPLENEIKKIEGVESVEVIRVDRALG